VKTLDGLEVIILNYSLRESRASLDVCICREKSIEDLEVTIINSSAERRRVKRTQNSDVGFCREKPVDDLEVTIRSSRLERRTSIDVGPCREKPVDNVEVTTLSSSLECRITMYTLNLIMISHSITFNSNPNPRGQSWPLRPSCDN
jgi:hypothetical protein